jgi:hypothetical protein
LEQPGLSRAPGDNVVDLKGDADAEQHRQRDDVGSFAGGNISGSFPTKSGLTSDSARGRT